MVTTCNIGFDKRTTAYLLFFTQLDFIWGGRGKEGGGGENNWNNFSSNWCMNEVRWVFFSYHTIDSAF